MARKPYFVQDPRNPNTVGMYARRTLGSKPGPILGYVREMDPNRAEVEATRADGSTRICATMTEAAAFLDGTGT